MKKLTALAMALVLALTAVFVATPNEKASASTTVHNYSCGAEYFVVTEIVETEICPVCHHMPRSCTRIETISDRKIPVDHIPGIPGVTYGYYNVYSRTGSVSCSNCGYGYPINQCNTSYSISRGGIFG